MSDLNDLIDRTHFDYEQNETKAKQLEDRILKVPGMSKEFLPKRQYGQEYKGDQLGVTAQSLIVKGDKPLAAFLGLDLNYWKEKAKAEDPYRTLAIFCKNNLNQSNYQIYVNYPDKCV